MAQLIEPLAPVAGARVGGEVREQLLVAADRHVEFAQPLADTDHQLAHGGGGGLLGEERSEQLPGAAILPDLGERHRLLHGIGKPGTQRGRVGSGEARLLPQERGQPPRRHRQHGRPPPSLGDDPDHCTALVEDGATAAADLPAVGHLEPHQPAEPTAPQAGDRADAKTRRRAEIAGAQLHPEREARGEQRVGFAQAAGVADLQVGRRPSVDLEQGEIAAPIDRDDAGGEPALARLAGGEEDAQVPRLGGDVPRGDDLAVGRDEEAAPRGAEPVTAGMVDPDEDDRGARPIDHLRGERLGANTGMRGRHGNGEQRCPERPRRDSACHAPPPRWCDALRASRWPRFGSPPLFPMPAGPKRPAGATPPPVPWPARKGRRDHFHC